MKRVLVIDNYDSFTFNLVHLIEKVSAEVKVDVVRNDEIDFQVILNYDGVVLSPGPGIPQEAGRLLDVIGMLRGKLPIFGVCLGHQAIGFSDGASLINLEKVFHGVATKISVVEDDTILLRHVPSVFQAGRYHSWVIDGAVSKGFRITARDEEGNVMAMESKEERLYGVQFHPESIMTEYGEQIMRNFLNS